MCMEVDDSISARDQDRCVKFWIGIFHVDVKTVRVMGRISCRDEAFIEGDELFEKKLDEDEELIEKKSETGNDDLIEMREFSKENILSFLIELLKKYRNKTANGSMYEDLFPGLIIDIGRKIPIFIAD